MIIPNNITKDSFTLCSSGTFYSSFAATEIFLSNESSCGTAVILLPILILLPLLRSNYTSESISYLF